MLAGIRSEITKTDKDLRQDAIDELEWEPSVNAAHVGVITLSGHVSSFAERYTAERAAKRVYGVKAVAEELEVKLPTSTELTDEDIAAACVNAFKHHYAVPNDKIKVVVSKGWVTLEGEVDWQHQKDAAHGAVRFVTGVKGVSNNIELKPHVTAADVKHKIEVALRRSADSMLAASPFKRKQDE